MNKPTTPTRATSTRDEIHQLMTEFIIDCSSAEGYGHALPVEVVRRAARIMQLSRGTGYGPPPPARCAACDSE